LDLGQSLRLQSVRRGEVGVYENQALVLVNFGKGTAQDIKKLAGEMVYRVKERPVSLFSRKWSLLVRKRRHVRFAQRGPV